MNRIRTILALFLFATILIWNQPSYADNLQTLTIVADEDVWVDAAQPTTNFDDAATLAFAVEWIEQENGPVTVYCPEITRQVLLKFDLSEVMFPIDKARLSVSPLIEQTNGTAPMLLAASADTWTETNVVWVSTPAITDVPMPAPGTYHESGLLFWEDDGTVPPFELAEWLDGQRGANGGDDTATLLFTIAVTTGCWPFPPDDGGFSAEFRNRLSEMPPILEVASAETGLPQLPKPSAVSVNNLQTTQHAQLLPAAASILGIMTLFARRRTSAPIQV